MKSLQRNKFTFNKNGACPPFLVAKQSAAQSSLSKYCDLKSFHEILEVEKKWYASNDDVYPILSIYPFLRRRTMKRALLALLAVAFLSTGMIFATEENKTAKKSSCGCCKEKVKKEKKTTCG